MSFTADQEQRFVKIKTMHGKFFEVRALFFSVFDGLYETAFFSFKRKSKIPQQM